MNFFPKADVSSKCRRNCFIAGSLKDQKIIFFCFRMSKKKGVSAEEKRTRMLQLFYERKEFFQLKELEKIAPKEKGIVAQSVKDVVQSLVDEGLVDTDKIGTSVYFWAFPSKAKHTRKRKVEELEEKLNEITKKLKKSKESVDEAKKGRQDSDSRVEILQRVSELKTKKDTLSAELKKYKDNDPEIFQEMKKENQIAKEAANRWTDNIFAIKTWCKNKFMIEGAALDKQFGIPVDMDYID